MLRNPNKYKLKKIVYFLNLNMISDFVIIAFKPYMAFVRVSFVMIQTVFTGYFQPNEYEWMQYFCKFVVTKFSVRNWFVCIRISTLSNQLTSIGNCGIVLINHKL